MPVPGVVAANLVLVEADGGLRGLELLRQAFDLLVTGLNDPPGPRSR
ncbi:hypothetical protein [Amycolatopsis sp. lyj-109]